MEDRAVQKHKTPPTQVSLHRIVSVQDCIHPIFSAQLKKS